MKYFDTKKDSLEEAISKAINEKPDSSNQLKEARYEIKFDSAEFGQDDEDDYMAVPDGNLHVFDLNTRTVGDNFALKNKTMKALAKRVNSKGKDRVWWKGV